MPEIDLKKSVHELTEEYPELIEVLRDADLKPIVNPLLRKTVGRKTTIPAGCRKRGVDLEEIKNELTRRGFKIKND